MQQPGTVYAVGEFVRRVVDSLLRGDCRGSFLCARCLVKLAKDHLDPSYAVREIAQAMEGIFQAPGRITCAPLSTCAACATKNVPCLGVGG